MKKVLSILILSLVISSVLVTAKTYAAAGQPKKQTTITLIDVKNNINEQTKLIKGTDLTPDCKYPWTIQKYNNSEGLQVIDVNNGKLSFQILPSRGMVIRQVAIGSQNPGWNAPAIGNTPASFVEVVIDPTPPCKITIRGKIDEALPNDSKLQTITEISTVPGTSTFQFSNTVDFAAINAKASVSEKPAITIAELRKPRPGQTWESSFTEWFGKPAPDFTIPDITGKTQKISDYKGKNIIINIWATWCPPCKKEIPDLIELRKTTSENELAILGISTEKGQTDLVKKFASEQKMNYTILVADPATLAPPYSKIEAIPTSFFIDPSGNLKFATIGTLNLKDINRILQAK